MGRIAAPARVVVFALATLAASPIHPAAAQSAADRREAAAAGFDGIVETETFAVAWRTSEAGEEQVRGFLETADEFRSRLADAVGPSRTPDGPIVIVLGGAGRRSDGSWRFPNVDGQGRVFLYHYGGEFSEYAVELAHELVHAFRRLTGHPYTRFWEEGLAEALAMRVDPEDTGFPRYGYPLTIAAGHLLAWDEALTLRDVRERHEELGRSCQLQSYLLRASFFDYLADRGGVDALIDLAYGIADPTDADLERVYGAGFDALADDWNGRLLAEFRTTPGADDAARRYRSEPPIASRPVCT